MKRNIDLDLLRTFVTIAETGSFTRTGELLGRTQSAISLQIKRLELLVDQTLLQRGPRHLALTAAGERMLGKARRMLRYNDELLAELYDPDLSGAVRLGVPEDFATAHLPAVLATFAEAHPLVELEVTCDLTLNLLPRFHAGHYDLVLVKREPAAAPEGIRVWREPLVWVGRDRQAVAGFERVPLIVSPEPCVYRQRATSALDAIGRKWRAAYVSTSLAGSQAAARAGLGITVLPRELVPEGLVALVDDPGLPPLYDTEIALLEASAISDPAHRLAQHIAQALERGD